MAEPITDQIATNATAPASASGDSGSMSQHSLSEQIAADRYVRQTKAKRGGIRMSKLVPPGALGVDVETR